MPERSAREEATMRVVPASMSQEQLWLSEQVDRNAALYNDGIGFRLRGRLDIAALTQAIDYVESRHDILRTSFPTVDGLPVLAVREPGRASLQLIDLRQVMPPERERELKRRCDEAVASPYDFATTPAWRVSLFVLDDEDQLLLFA